MIILLFSSGQYVSISWYAFCCNKNSRIRRATSRISCCLAGKESEPTSCTISINFSSSCRMLIIWLTRGLQSLPTLLANQGSSVLRYKLYEFNQLIEGKCRRCASFASSAQKVLVTRSVDCVTGSEKSPPGGLTAPIIVTLPVSPLFSSFSFPVFPSFPSLLFVFAGADKGMTWLARS